ncbi:MAG: DNA-binding response regulator [Desulfobulbaceae bacterium A2]|nr:MAG: DNA-binding response regulator [Desulfobulbaceae bacterium A2]
MRILLVDDEEELRLLLGDILRRQGYAVETASNGVEALDKMYVRPFDLIILDIMLPDKDGLAVLRELRAAGITTPVIMLTARREVHDRVVGLDLGADDYLAKPFSAAELLARIRALFRRGTEHSRADLAIGDIRLDTKSREVRQGDGLIELTPREFSLLEFLLYNKNRVVTRFNLAERVWGEDFDPFTMSNVIDVHIRNLRRKLGDAEGRIVRTVRGVGYIVREGDA